MAEEITISREELYKLVWSKPVVEIAKDFGISDVAIGKICKKLNIPKPGLGYWAKKQAGKRVRQTPLPKLNPGNLASYTIRKKAPMIIETESETIRQHRKFEDQSKNRIVVKSTLRSPHPLVQQSQSHLNSARPDQYDKLSVGRDCLDIAVGKESIHRALLIMDVLLKALEKRGYNISLSDSHKETTSVNIHGEQIRFGLFETSRKVMKSKENKEIRDHFFTPWYYVTTGILSLRIHEYFCDEKSLSDGKSQRLESSLNNFVLMLVKTAERKKIRHQELVEERRVSQEKAQRKEEVRHKEQKEVEMVQQLFDNAVSWNKCKLDRGYIAAVRENSDGDEVDSWINWASEKVDQVESSLFESV